MTSLSVIILSYNTQDYLRNLLISLKKTSKEGFEAEIIVVDNASADESVPMVKRNFPETAVIENKKNFGFSKANNQAAKKAKGDYLLFLNSDTKVEKNTLKKMVAFFNDNDQVATATCRLSLPSGELDPASHRGFPTLWNAFCYFTGLERLFPNIKLFSGYHQKWKNFKTVHEVDVISGAFFMIRKEVFKSIGGFDERFFMYAEDIDLCQRIKDKDYKIFYYPKAKAIHYKRQSGRKKAMGKLNTQEVKKERQEAKKHFYETMKIYYEKHYEKKYPRIAKYLVLMGIWIISKFKN